MCLPVDLGRKSIVKHEIRTSESKPIRQNPRRLPSSQRAVAEADIQNMLKRGVIEPTSTQLYWSVKRMGPPGSASIIASSTLLQ